MRFASRSSLRRRPGHRHPSSWSVLGEFYDDLYKCVLIEARQGCVGMILKVGPQRASRERQVVSPSYDSTRVMALADIVCSSFLALRMFEDTFLPPFLLHSSHFLIARWCYVTSWRRQLDGTSFLYKRHLNLYLVAVTRANVNPAMVFELLAQKIRIFKAYFKNDFDEDTLRNNMTLILELMDGERRGGRQRRCSVSIF